MSDEGESFLARWSRLKRERAAGLAGGRGAPEGGRGVGAAELPRPVETPGVETALAGAQPVGPLRADTRIGEAPGVEAPLASARRVGPLRTDTGIGEAPAVLDLASLPPIESLGPGSDISAYLVAGVPLELTRAALRSAWRADPAVREFVEMADNQWDFNLVEGGIPGFGALGEVEGAKGLLARAATVSAEDAAGVLAAVKTGGEKPGGQGVSGVSGLALDESRFDGVWRAGGVAPAVERLAVETPMPATRCATDGDAEIETPTTSPARQRDVDVETPSPGRHLHGSALPK